MFLKQLTEKKTISIDYYANGAIQTIKGRVYQLNLLEQLLHLKDEKQKSYTIQLSGIRQIY